ncbi:thioredoxin domain-containing protein 16 [Brachionichthys hirsutus]|uniref:thioredoxin domain-containing protein 16 n=1 Tax=Brachionichthys hirsutus TaxID=412623 RepID=UPI003604692D
MWVSVVFFLLWTGSGRCAEINTPDLIDYTAADFHDKLHSGRMMFVFFQHRVSPTIALFLVELEKSAAALEDFGVLVGKVNCNKEKVPAYCTEQKMPHSAFLFRDGKEFLNFDLDTVFDVNSIVSEVLFAILREEVKYVHTDTDLLIVEKAARGGKDIVLGYVSSLGTREHRSLMETAYVYGSKYQFILITGGPVLKNLGVDEASFSSRVWFLHCKDQPVASKHCQMSLMIKPLSTLRLHSFLQLMEAPLVSEVYDDPSSVQPPPFPYQQTPQVFIFSQPETAHLDLNTATTLAWKLRGLALLVLVHRESPAVKTLSEYNAAYRLPEMSSEVTYLTLHSLDELLELFVLEEGKKQSEEEDDLNFEREEILLDKLDDEIAASVFENRLKTLDMDSVIELTSDSFHSTVAQSRLTVALFYFKWDAVSTTFMKSYTEVAERLADSKVQMSVVNCGDWTDLCAAQTGSSVPIPFQPMTSFPTVLLLRPQESAQYYRGMLDAAALHRFILLNLQPSPVLLSTQEELTSFLQEVPSPELARHKPERVVGLFETQSHTGVSLFNEAAESLRGEVLTGLLTDELAKKWAAEHSLDLPAVFVFPSWRTDTYPSTLSVATSADELLSDINAALLHPLPELTVENLPSFLAIGKALVILFVGEEEDEVGLRQNQALVGEMRRLVEVGGERMSRYLACWIHLGRTPAGMSVLGSYLGSMPPLPALVLAHLPNGSEIYQYSPNTPIEAPSVVQWLQRVEDGTESAAGMLGNDSWPPAAEFYDFLKIMDMYESPDVAEKEKVWSKESSMKEKMVEESTAGYSSPDKKQYIHSEL